VRSKSKKRSKHMIQVGVTLWKL